MPKVNLVCRQCGYKWLRRGPQLPRQCPKPGCGSRHWNKPIQE